MRLRDLLCITACMLLLTGCAKDPLTPLSESSATLPAPSEDNLQITRSTATLWFRFLDEPCLAAENRHIESSPALSYEQALLSALIGGPGAASPELNTLFPQGTRVLSTHRQDQVLFVTLSKEIMNSLADEPDSWATDSVWATEIPLRRKLAMQSIAATATENCSVDTVVILVEQAAMATDSLRLRQGYYCTGDDAMALAPVLKREESLLLTPGRTAEIILQCWQERDFPRLYRYVAPTDPYTGAPRPELDTFLQSMSSMPHLTGASLTGCSVDAQGVQAVFSLQLTTLEDGRPVTQDAAILRLHRIGGVWRIGLSQLDARKGGRP